MTTYNDADARAQFEQEERDQQEAQAEQELAAGVRWAAAGKPCHAGGEPHTFRNFCGTCDPAATPEQLAAFCDQPLPGSGEWTCANCANTLCAGGHTHTRNAGELCPLC